MAIYMAPDHIRRAQESLNQTAATFQRKAELKQRRAESLLQAGIATDDRTAIAQAKNLMSNTPIADLFGTQYKRKTFDSGLEERKLEKEKERTEQGSIKAKLAEQQQKYGKRKDYQQMFDEDVTFQTGKTEDQLRSEFQDTYSQRLEQKTNEIMEDEETVEHYRSLYNALGQDELGRQEIEGMSEGDYISSRIIDKARQSIDAQSGTAYKSYKQEQMGGTADREGLVSMLQKRNNKSRRWAESLADRWMDNPNLMSAGQKKTYGKYLSGGDSLAGQKAAVADKQKIDILNRRIDAENKKIAVRNKVKGQYNEKVGKIQKMLKGDADQQEQGFGELFEFELGRAGSYNQAARAARKYITNMSAHAHAYGNQPPRLRVEDVIGKRPKGGKGGFGKYMRYVVVADEKGNTDTVKIPVPPGLSAYEAVLKFAPRFANQGYTEAIAYEKKLGADEVARIGDRFAKRGAVKRGIKEQDKSNLLKKLDELEHWYGDDKDAIETEIRSFEQRYPDQEVKKIDGEYLFVPRQGNQSTRRSYYLNRQRRTATNAQKQQRRKQPKNQGVAGLLEKYKRKDENSRRRTGLPPKG